MPGKTAVITGATSGIGAAFAEALARQGFDLFLTGRRRERIEEVAGYLRERHDVSVQVSIVELSDIRQVDRLIEEIAAIPVISYLVNNAGFGQGGSFAQDPEAGYRMLMVHVVSAVRLTGAVASRMAEAGEGAIIHVSSVAAFFPMPGNYSATKRYLVAFSESLHTELASRGVRIQALCPGMTRTDFHSRMGVEGEKIQQRYFLGWMQPEKVVQLSLRHLGNGRVIYTPGILNKFLVRFLSRMPRRLYYKVISRIPQGTGK